jgi:hypothetical protein
VLGSLTADFDFEQSPRPPLILPQRPVPAASAPTKARGMLVVGTITALGSSSVTVQVTATGPHDTYLMGQTLTVAIAPSTVVQGSLQVGGAVSMRIVKSGGGYTATLISVS